MYVAVTFCISLQEIHISLATVVTSQTASRNVKENEEETD